MYFTSKVKVLFLGRIALTHYYWSINSWLKRSSIKWNELQPFVYVHCVTCLTGFELCPTSLQTFFFFTWWYEVWSFVFQGPVDGFWPPHSDALMMQNIAHFFNLFNSFLQVVVRKRLAPILLIEGPVLLICVRLLRGVTIWQYESHNSI